MEIKNIPLADLKDFFTYFQIVTAIAGSLCYYKYKDTYLKYFLFLLWYIVINDFTARYYSKNISVYNVFFYNIFQVISFTFYALLFKNAIKSLKNRQIISILLAFYYLCYLINLVFIDDFFTDYFSNTYIIGAAVIITSILIYLYEILNSDKIIHVNKMMVFWISIGLLLMYLPNIPFNVIRNYYKTSPTIPYIYMVNFLLVFIYNIIIISGFIWSSKEQRDYF
ncbi:hypothetical protein ACFO3U_06780 [Flavobacterium ponti]|jgi:hypothetical protein|uniref:Uncharacterized protein n=1 Tax=Flavobacterium ponti TaxID=665133 RepID=A0ABV9P506_9FLAO